ncbi:hypothetical protein [Bradyrhizobium pachyrhizi]|uniref:hypothetical protein n=1 Tax=Bradyrhizobium pachyrhizi TaxID=280333 RepID=UPI0018DF72BF|nr:hypothetical protein [Bradyrhizobium pachyrhizi]
MAARNRNTQVGETSNVVDLAVLAKREVDLAGEDDAAYDYAIAKLETTPATTAAGVKAKFDLLWSRVEALLEDAGQTDLSVFADLAKGIDTGLTLLQREAA